MPPTPKPAPRLENLRFFGPKGGDKGKAQLHRPNGAKLSIFKFGDSYNLYFYRNRKDIASEFNFQSADPLTVQSLIIAFHKDELWPLPSPPSP